MTKFMEMENYQPTPMYSPKREFPSLEEMKRHIANVDWDEIKQMVRNFDGEPSDEERCDRYIPRRRSRIYGGKAPLPVTPETMRAAMEDGAQVEGELEEKLKKTRGSSQRKAQFRGAA